MVADDGNSETVCAPGVTSWIPRRPETGSKRRGRSLLPSSTNDRLGNGYCGGTTGSGMKEPSSARRTALRIACTHPGNAGFAEDVARDETAADVDDDDGTGVAFLRYTKVAIPHPPAYTWMAAVFTGRLDRGELPIAEMKS
jgi:hypothetical protein